ncbi:MAG: gamma-glutamyl-gamma-aminobutyrate hydrolase family protein [Firmicutes bacterium]|nr:gamma-glutamyl-gamma-aminobutyrate hydrolase family protein [Bacillota bacterium]
MNRPLIGLTCSRQESNPRSHYVSEAYIQAVLAGGGTPVLIPYQPKQELFQALGSLDGLILPGGLDVDPNRYGEDPSPECGKVDPFCDELDLNAAGFALEKNLPILAICRGAQVLNIALGGSLVQDIPTQIRGSVQHEQKAPRWYASHDISLQTASILGGIWGRNPTRVNSFHHQSIAKLGQGLRVVASASDGVVEAVESTRHRFVLGVQWHPEAMIDHYPAALEIFKHFIQAAKAK